MRQLETKGLARATEQPQTSPPGRFLPLAKRRVRRARMKMSKEVGMPLADETRGRRGEQSDGRRRTKARKEKKTHKHEPTFPESEFCFFLDLFMA